MTDCHWFRTAVTSEAYPHTILLALSSVWVFRYVYSVQVFSTMRHVQARTCRVILCESYTDEIMNKFVSTIISEWNFNYFYVKTSSF